MKQSHPPRLATWMLRHMLPGEHHDALVGDLLEEFRAGRSAGWFRRQVLAGIAVAYGRKLRANGSALLFAGFWALLAPACIPLPPLTHFRDFDNAFWKLDSTWNLTYPWSNICNLALTFIPMLAFVWAGLLLYLLLESFATGRFSFRRFRRGIVRSASVFMPLWMAGWLLPLIFPDLRVHVPGAMTQHPDALFLLARPVSVVILTPFFLTLLWAIWDASHVQGTRKWPLR